MCTVTKCENGLDVRCHRATAQSSKNAACDMNHKWNSIKFCLYKIFELVDVLQDKLVIVFLVATLFVVLIQHGVQGKNDVFCRFGQSVA